MPNARPCRTSRSSSSADFLGDPVVLDEELLELVDDQQDPRHAASSGRASRKPLRSCTPTSRNRSPRRLQLGVEPLQHAEAELPLALDGDDPGVRQLVRRRRP